MNDEEDSLQNGLVNQGLVPSVTDPLKSHFLRESSSFKYRRKKRVSFGTITIEDRRPPRSSISSVVLRGKGTVLRYIELEKVIVKIYFCPPPSPDQNVMSRWSSPLLPASFASVYEVSLYVPCWIKWWTSIIFCQELTVDFHEILLTVTKINLDQISLGLIAEKSEW